MSYTAFLLIAIGPGALSAWHNLNEASKEARLIELRENVAEGLIRSDTESWRRFLTGDHFNITHPTQLPALQIRYLAGILLLRYPSTLRMIMHREVAIESSPEFKASFVEAILQIIRRRPQQLNSYHAKIFIIIEYITVYFLDVNLMRTHSESQRVKEFLYSSFRLGSFRSALRRMFNSCSEVEDALGRNLSDFSTLVDLFVHLKSPISVLLPPWSNISSKANQLILCETGKMTGGNERTIIPDFTSILGSSDAINYIPGELELSQDVDLNTLDTPEVRWPISRIYTCANHRVYRP